MRIRSSAVVARPPQVLAANGEQSEVSNAGYSPVRSVACNGAIAVTRPSNATRVTQHENATKHFIEFL